MQWKRLAKWLLTAIALAIYLCWWLSLSLSIYLTTPAARVGIETGVCRVDRSGGFAGVWSMNTWPRDPAFMDRYGLSLPRTRKGGTEIEIPLWLPFAITAVPALWLWSHTRQRSPGQCETCDYDLTGNTSGICPECGSARERTKGVREQPKGAREPGS